MATAAAAPRKPVWPLLKNNKWSPNGLASEEPCGCGGGGGDLGKTADKYLEGRGLQVGEMGRGVDLQGRKHPIEGTGTGMGC